MRHTASKPLAIFIALLTILAAPTPARASSFCVDALINKVAEFFAEGEESHLRQAWKELREPSPATDVPHVKVTRMGRDEQSRVSIARFVNEPWSSTFSPLEGSDAKLGDPRRFLGMLREYSPEVALRAAHYFGFGMIDERHLLAPGVLLFRKQTAALGLDAMPDYYPVRGEVTVRDTLEGYAKNLGVPMDTDGLLRVHDLAYHSGLIFLPPVLLRHSQRQVQAYLDFLDFIAPQILSAPAATELMVSLSHVTTYVAGLLDTSSGNFMTRYSKGHGPQAARIAFVDLTLGGRSPHQFLQALVNPPFGAPMTTLSREHREWLWKRLQEYSLRRQDSEFTRRLYDQYEALWGLTLIEARIHAVVKRATEL